MSERILLTGCAGFIGSFVARRLCEMGYQVLGVDDLNDYYDVNLKLWRLELLSEYKNFEFLKMDISSRESVFSLKGQKFSAILNLGARAGVRASLKNPKLYFDVNLTGTLNLLDLCVQNGIKKFVLASTSSIYANCPLPFTEDMRTDFLISPYASSKKSAELICYTYHHIYGIDVTVPRYFTVYGPAGRPDMSVFIFVKNIMEGRPIRIFGDGKQKRDFTYIDDIVDGTIRCMELGSGFDIINLGNNKPVELIYVVRLIEQNLSKTANIIFEKPNLLDLPATWADINKAQNLLRWTPKTSIEDGIRRTVEWFIQNEKRIRKIKVEDWS
ncbi:MAG: NAD-dependent epimerase/dehydratase family protein [Candidatus Calescibacterium sp.]|nr:NAD-dependent epimerase/dehydratase family protein [Candidatus Calescibacterium sp.]MCX7734892.1 NAD-dependent epimerase/dehydratase family protein [bacterium]MDW8086583.1 NAD-dependent epimerase/dehydratase family protein [Candidatus Calescibacterium sp.]